MCISFFIACQDERRGTEAVDPALITADLSELRANALATFEAVLQKSWESQRIQEGWRWCIQTTPDIVAFLNVAHNSMLRAARDFGSQADPLVVWVRKADEFLLQQVVSAYIEQETDLSSLFPIHGGVGCHPSWLFCQSMRCVVVLWTYAMS